MNVNWIDIIVQLSDGMWRSLLIFGLTLLFSMPLGLVVAFGRMSKWAPLRFLRKHKNPLCRFLASIKPIQLITKLYISVLRGTPLMLQLIIIFYGPGLMFDLPAMPRFTATIVAFAVNYACYFSEIYRGGIESISKGQYEACHVLGMSKSQAFFNVVLLQVIKRIIAPMSNEIITLVKDTSLARVIAVGELIMAAQDIVSVYGLLWPLFYTAIFYLIFCGILTVLFGKLEKKLDYYRG